MKTLAEWLVRGEKPKKVRKPLPRVTPKRAKQNREYSVRRKRYLLAHPLCQAYFKIKEHLGEMTLTTPACQFATEIHHTRKPKCKYLNDESTWLAVCSWSHRFIEQNKGIARQLGLLF